MLVGGVVRLGERPRARGAGRGPRPSRCSSRRGASPRPRPRPPGSPASRASHEGCRRLPCPPPSACTSPWLLIVNLLLRWMSWRHIEDIVYVCKMHHMFGAVAETVEQLEGSGGIEVKNDSGQH